MARAAVLAKPRLGPPLLAKAVFAMHLDQAPAPSQPLRGPVPYATVLTCPRRAAQASSALENFVGEVYRGIDCKVSHELYQVARRRTPPVPDFAVLESSARRRRSARRSRGSSSRRRPSISTSRAGAAGPVPCL